ncbi:hypothetical protein ACFQVD_09495 [Streptosporangium amethystogenes subsp. fukuiense]|uniref:Uncharacterized protein n=1 Tax=Streptosporangium amethystogenes subsp. fukuiense TaxID=698418 RepID=A0ABW2SWU3_9ACTN
MRTRDGVGAPLTDTEIAAFDADPACPLREPLSRGTPHGAPPDLGIRGPPKEPIRTLVLRFAAEGPPGCRAEYRWWRVRAARATLPVIELFQEL